MMFERFDDVLDITGDAAELPDRLPARAFVGRARFQLDGGIGGARQRGGDLVGIVGEFLAAAVVESGEGSEPTV